MLGADGQIDTIEGTSIHPIWPVDRDDWVPLGELTEGEQLLGSAGTATILTHTTLHRTTPVYNIEIHGHHVYQVGALELLVHNAADDCVLLYKASQRAIGGMTEFNDGFIGRWFAKDGWIAQAYAHPNILTHENFVSILTFDAAEYTAFLKKFEGLYVGSDIEGTLRHGTELEIPKGFMKLFNDLIIDKSIVPWNRL